MEEDRKEEIRSEVLGSYASRFVVRKELSQHGGEKHPSFSDLSAEDKLKKFRGEKGEKGETVKSSFNISNNRGEDKMEMKSARQVQLADPLPEMRMRSDSNEMEVPRLSKNCSGFDSISEQAGKGEVVEMSGKEKP